MGTSIPHVSFIASIEHDEEYPHPPGASFARQLEVMFNTSPAENWRDIGWRIDMTVCGKQIEVYFAQFGGEESWLLGIAPLRQSSLFSRLLGRNLQQYQDELKELADEIHTLLINCSASNILWMLGGPPGKVPTVERPEQLAW